MSKHTNELAEREPDDIRMIETADVEGLMTMQFTLLKEINRRRRLLNSVRRRIRELNDTALRTKEFEK